tara:strand:+ start:2534 stop:3559 length:1026 start_codon:yes stop_codon:yes gene_type:complete
MATIRLKKRAASGAAGAPSSLAPSEIAFNEADKKLYYGFGDDGSGGASSIISVAGEGAVMHLGNVNQTAAGNKTFTGNVVVGGNLTVNGTTSTLSTTNSVVSDKLIELGNGVSGVPSGDAGIVIERGSSSNAIIGWDESADKFIVGTGSFTGSSTGNLSITKGTLQADIDGDVVGNVTGNVTGSATSCTGNAATATKLATARTIAGVSFDGTSNIALNNANITNGAGYVTANTQLTNEQVQDIVGAMFSGNTETGITATYQDGDGTLDLVVATQSSNDFTTALKNKLDGIAAGATNVTNTNQLTNGAGFVTSSIISSLNASNLSSGTVPAARLGTVDGGTF